MNKENKFEVAYSESKCWSKLKRYAKTAGTEVVEKALLLFYASQEEKAPAWAKTTIAAALGYFIVPLDAITDLLPGAERPTIMQLAGDTNQVALHVVSSETLFWETMEQLKALGASSILVLPIEKMME